MEELEYQGKIIKYHIERKKIKNCYIYVKDSIVSIKVPQKMALKSINQLLEKRAEWILKNLEKQQKCVKIPKKYEDGEIFKVLGKESVLKVSYQNVKKAKLQYLNNCFFVSLPNEFYNNLNVNLIIQRLLDKFYMELAKIEVEKAMKNVTSKVQIFPNKYKVKRLKSTWGNCSSTKNISINKDVVMHSKHAIEYVCLHEVCHLKYMNHSKNFWNMVEKYMPDYKQAEAELKM